MTPLAEHVGLTPDVIAILTDDVNSGVMFSAIALLIAVDVVTQLRLVVITQVILPAAVPASI